MTIIEELVEIIKTKNSWGKNELLMVLMELMAKRMKDSK